MKRIMIKKHKFILIVAGVLFTTTSSCKKLIEVNPPIDAIIGKEIFNNDRTAASVLTGLLSEISGSNLYGLTTRMGVYSDEFVSVADPSTLLGKLYLNSLRNEGDQLFWSGYYDKIFKANSAIEGVSASHALSVKVKNQLTGEAKFIRAFLYFYLVNLYGDIPLVLTTDPKVNLTLGKTNQDIIFNQIIQDLKDAQESLNFNYVHADIISNTDQRLRPNKATATALLARVYLFLKDWRLAEAEASKIILDSRFQLESVSNTFTISSKEAIWQLQPIEFGINTYDANEYVLKAGKQFADPGPNGADRPVYISDDLYDAFELGDNRKASWTDTVQIAEPGSGKILMTYPYTFKYKAWGGNEPRTEYLVVFRLAEQYLIRAEALAQLGDLQLAARDINQIRKRAGLDDLTFLSLDEALEKILAERRLEFFAEFGHRWFDLKRTGRLDSIMAITSAGRGATWHHYEALLPIPMFDILNNPSLKGQQNPGYL